MLKIFLSFVFAIFFQTLVAQTDVNFCDSFNINISIKGKFLDSLGVIYYDCKSDSYKREIKKVQNESVIISGQIRKAAELILLTDIKSQFVDGPKVARFLIEPAQMTALIDIQNGIVDNIEVTGSKSQEEKENWEKENKEQFTAIAEYSNLLYPITPPKDENAANQLKKMYKIKIDSLNEVQIKMALQYVREHPNSYFSGYLLRRCIRKIPIDSSQIYYSNFGDQVKQSQFGRSILKEVFALTKNMSFRRNNSDSAFFSHLEKIKGLHSLQLPGKDGKMHNLSIFKGYYVLIDFWGSWCAPCFENFPYLKNLKAEMKGYPIKFVSISIDSDWDKWKKNLKKHKIPGLNLIDTANLASNFYNIAWVPKYIIINPDGSIANNDAPTPLSGQLKPLLISIIKNN